MIFIFLILIYRDREKEREKDIDFVVPLIYASIGCFLCVPGPGIELTALACRDVLYHLGYPARAKPMFSMQMIYLLSVFLIYNGIPGAVKETTDFIYI